DKIAAGAVTTDDIANGAVTAEKIAIPSGQSGVLSSDGGVPRWSKIGSLMLESEAVTEGNIADGAVTIEKTAGVVGMVPVGAEGATTYGSFWIE
ncbi:MAG: hypothetical protein Q4C08_04185, partial [Pseudomonadota bacterium]|nr:hypothetical protein [Pseudomonadota bacterium]